jgi:hypothetical protein
LRRAGGGADTTAARGRSRAAGDRGGPGGGRRAAPLERGVDERESDQQAGQADDHEDCFAREPAASIPAKSRGRRLNSDDAPLLVAALIAGALQAAPQPQRPVIRTAVSPRQHRPRRARRARPVRRRSARRATSRSTKTASSRRLRAFPDSRRPRHRRQAADGLPRPVPGFCFRRYALRATRRDARSCSSSTIFIWTSATPAGSESSSRGYRRELVHDGDLIAIVSTGPSSIAVDLTYDRTRLDEAIRRVSGAALKPQEIIETPGGASGRRNPLSRARRVFYGLRDPAEPRACPHRRKAVRLHQQRATTSIRFTSRAKAGRTVSPSIMAGEGRRPRRQSVLAERRRVRRGRPRRRARGADARRRTAPTRRSTRSTRAVLPPAARSVTDEGGTRRTGRITCVKTQSSLRVLAELTGGSP